MLVQILFGYLLDTINTFDSNLQSWVRQPRLNKPKGILNYIISELKDLDNELILKKLKKLEKSTDIINKIILMDINDNEKKNNIINLMTSPYDELPKFNCYICKKYNCDHISFCETKINNWLGI